MQKEMVVTLNGNDKLGLVKYVSNAIFKAGGNVIQSRMTHLGGEFAGILLLSIDSEKIKNLLSSLKEMESETLHFHTKINKASQETRFESNIPCEITVTGADHEGIIYEITDYISKQGANIEELSTNITNAPISGIPLFSMKALINLPPNLERKSLKNTLNQIADEIGVEITLN